MRMACLQYWRPTNRPSVRGRAAAVGHGSGAHATWSALLATGRATWRGQSGEHCVVRLAQAVTDPAFGEREDVLVRGPGRAFKLARFRVLREVTLEELHAAWAVDLAAQRYPAGS
jgi:hypothetical protein